MTHPEIIVSRAAHSASEEVAGAFVEKLAFDALWLEKEQWRMACERTEFAFELSMDITECQDALSAYVGIVYDVAMIALAERETALLSQLGQANINLLLAVAAKAALQSQLGQAHEQLLLAQADAETLRTGFTAVFYAQTFDERARLRKLAREAHPGAALADEVTAGRAELVQTRRDNANVAALNIDLIVELDAARGVVAAAKKARACLLSSPDMHARMVALSTALKVYKDATKAGAS